MKSSSNHLPSFLSSLLFLVGGLLLSGMAMLMGITALAALVMGTGVSPRQTIFSVAFGFEAVLLFAAASFALQKYRQKPAADREASFSLSAGMIILLIGTTALAILTGYLIAGTEVLNWLLLPFLTIPAVVLPLGALLALATRKLPLGTRWQTWTVLGLAMTLGPFLLFALEILLAILLLMGAVVYIVSQPGLVSELQRLSEQIVTLGAQPEQVLEMLAPLLTRPGVMSVAFLYIAILVPAIEEIFKPIGVWLFAGKLDSRAQGFTLGALSGAGYALIETIGVSGQQAGEWASLLASRVGTGLLHITTSALVGAAIVLALRNRRYLRLLGTYMLAVFLHGSWNAFAMLFTFSTLAKEFAQPGGLSTLQPAAIGAMAALAAGLLLILILSNRRLRNAPAPALREKGRDAGMDAVKSL